MDKEKVKLLPHHDLLKIYVDYVELYSKMGEGLNDCKGQLRETWVDQMERIKEVLVILHDEILSRMMGMEIQ